MAEWNLYGCDRKEKFEESIEPEALVSLLRQYQKVLGDKFGITELLELEKIRAMALIAEAINDVPEFFISFNYFCKCFIQFIGDFCLVNFSVTGKSTYRHFPHILNLHSTNSNYTTRSQFYL